MYKSKFHLPGDSLPFLVLEKVFAYLNFNDLKSIRLSCTKWNEISTPYFVQRARVPLEFEAKNKAEDEIQQMSVLEMKGMLLDSFVGFERNLKNFYDVFENVDEIIYFESYRLQGNEFLRIPRLILLFKTRGELIKDLQIQFIPKISSSKADSLLELSWVMDLNNALFQYMPNVTNLVVHIYVYSYSSGHSTRFEANVEMDQMIRSRQLAGLEKFYLILHDDNDIIESSRRYAIERSILKQISANIISSAPQLKQLYVSNKIGLHLLNKLNPAKTARLTKLIVKMHNEYELESTGRDKKECLATNLLGKALQLKSLTIICQNLLGINIDSLYTFLQSQSSSLEKLEIREEGQSYNPPGLKCTLPILPRMYKLKELKLCLCADIFRFSNSDWLNRTNSLKILTIKYTTGDPALKKTKQSEIDPFTNFMLGTSLMASGRLEVINILACDYERKKKFSFQNCVEYFELAKKKFPLLKVLRLVDMPSNIEFCYNM